MKKAFLNLPFTGNDITTIARDQPDSEHKPETTTKTLSTETVQLTSFELTTSDHKRTNAVPTSSPKGTPTNYVSTESEYPNLFTQDQSFTMTRSVSVSSSLSSLSDTTGMKRTEYNTQTVPLDTNENRTIVNETTNTDLLYMTTCSLGM